MNRKVQLAFAAAILTMLGAGEVFRRSCSHGVKATHGCDTFREALVAPDGTGAEAIEVLWVEDPNPAKKGGREVLAELEGAPGTREHSGGYLDDLRIRDGYPRGVITHENCHVSKTVDPEGFLKVVRSIDSFLVGGG